MATKGRVGAVAAIVAVGASIYVGGTAAVESVIYTRDTIIERNALADYQVRFWSIEAQELPDLEKIEGVKHAEGRLGLNATLQLPDEEQPLQGFISCVPLKRDNKLNRIDIVEGRYFESDDDMEKVIIDKALQVYHDVNVGDRLKVTVGNATHEREVIGVAISPEYLVATSNPEFLVPQKGSLGVVYMLKEKWDDVYGADTINGVALDLEPSADASTFEEKLRPAFEAIEVDRFEPREENFGYAFLAKDTNAFKKMLPPIVGVFALVTIVIAFVIFGQLIRNERQEIGTMMALGISRGRIVGAYLAGGLTIGLVAGFIGFLLSFGISYVFIDGYSKALGLLITLPHYVDPGMIQIGFVKAMGFALVTSLISVGLPTLHITQLQPMDAVRPAMDVGSAMEPGPISKAFGKTAIARFSLRNVSRNRKRFVTTVLCIAGAIGVAMAYRTTARSIDETFGEYFDTDHWDVAAEYVEPQVVTAGERLNNLEHVKRIEEYAKGNVRAIGPGGHKVLQAIGLEYPSELKKFKLAEGRLPQKEGEAILYRKLMGEIGVKKLGDKFTMKGIEDKREYTVVGITTFSPTQIYTTLEDARFLLKQEQKVTGALVQAEPGYAEQVAEAARKNKVVGNVYLMSAIVDALRHQTQELLAIIYISIALAILVACLVLGATVIINVLERESDYAMLRVLGFKKKVVERGLLIEVMGTGIVGVLVAIPLSLGIARFLNWQVGEAFFHVKTVVEPVALGLIALIALLFLPIASRPGAKKIRQTNLAEAVRRKVMG